MASKTEIKPNTTHVSFVCQRCRQPLKLDHSFHTLERQLVAELTGTCIKIFLHDWKVFVIKDKNSCMYVMPGRVKCGWPSNRNRETVCSVWMLLSTELVRLIPESVTFLPCKRFPTLETQRNASTVNSSFSNHTQLMNLMKSFSWHQIHLGHLFVPDAYTLNYHKQM